MAPAPLQRVLIARDLIVPARRLARRRAILSNKAEAGGAVIHVVIWSTPAAWSVHLGPKKLAP
jgi:hypothetical protein